MSSYATYYGQRIILVGGTNLHLHKKAVIRRCKTLSITRNMVRAARTWRLLTRLMLLWWYKKRSTFDNCSVQIISIARVLHRFALPLPNQNRCHHSIRHRIVIGVHLAEYTAGSNKSLSSTIRWLPFPSRIPFPEMSSTVVLHNVIRLIDAKVSFANRLK